MIVPLIRNSCLSYSSKLIANCSSNSEYVVFRNRLVHTTRWITTKPPVYQLIYQQTAVPLSSASSNNRSASSISSYNWRFYSSSSTSNNHEEDKNDKDKTRKARRIRSTLYYLAAVGVLVGGGSYAAVPLYRIFCQSYSYGGTTGTHDATKDLSQMKRLKDKEITIRFNADKSSNMMWNFRPEQIEIVVTPGETALAFYRAENRTPHPIDGVSTYNVIPFEAGQYFNKIQCFCFEEQRLNPGETVELPVFFYIDPEFGEDPRMESVDLITLSYTFFESKDMPEGIDLGGWWSSGGHGSKNKAVVVKDGNNVAVA